MSNNRFKGTSGPWKVIDGWDDKGEGCFPSVIFYGTEDQYRKSLGRNGVTINASHDQKAESLMANAKLIAAAPELLEALQELIYLFDRSLPEGSIGYMKMTEAKDVLNKALK